MNREWELSALFSRLKYRHLVFFFFCIIVYIHGRRPRAENGESTASEAYCFRRAVDGHAEKGACKVE